MQTIKAYINKNNTVFFASIFCFTLLGLLFSRALLSLIHIVWLLLILLFANKKIIKQNKTAIVWSCLPFVFFWLGAWQTITEKDTYDYLLSLKTYPISFFSVLILNCKTQFQVKKIWIIVATTSFLIPLFYFLKDVNSAINAYSLGQVVYTPMDTDHVRYSIFLIAALILTQVTFSKTSKYIFSGFLFLFLLFLAVRTGWLGLLVVGFAIITQQFFTSLKKGIKLLILLGVAVTTAYFAFPQIKQKINYVVYDWQINNQTTANFNYSDGARFITNATAVSLIKNNYNVNVGWANIGNALETEFSHQHPNKTLVFHWPFNQFLFWYLGSGWWGCFLFLLWMIFPIVFAIKKRNIYLAIWQIFIAATCFTESTISLQFGIFLHTWGIALLWNMQPKIAVTPCNKALQPL